MFTEDPSDDINVICEYLGKNRRFYLTRPVKLTELVRKVKQVFVLRHCPLMECAFCDVPMFSEIKCEQDLETAIRLADRCANLSRSTTSLRVRLFDEAQSMPLSADAARLHDRGLPADELSKSSLSWTCLGDGSDSNRALKAPASVVSMTAAAVTSVSSSVTSRYSGNSAVFDSGPPSSKPMDCLPPGVLPQLTSVGRRSPTVEVFGQLQVARPRTGQQTTSFGGRTYPVSAAAAASPSSNCKWQPIEDAGGHFIPEDDSLPIRVNGLSKKTSGERAGIKLKGESCSKNVYENNRPFSVRQLASLNAGSNLGTMQSSLRGADRPVESMVSADNVIAPPKDWIMGDLLGGGSFGQVFVCHDRDDGRTMAVKQVTIYMGSRASTEQVDALRNEIRILQALQHPRVVRYFGSSVDQQNGRLFLFMEYMPAGSLKDQIDRFETLTEGLTRKYTRQMLEGLDFLHSGKVIHRDIKAANVLCDCNGDVKLSDFGAAKRLENISRMKTSVGTYHYMSPEVINGLDYDSKTDIWSLGCTVVEMLTGNPPYHQFEGIAAAYKIATCAYPSYELPANASRTAADFLSRCFVVDFKNRASAIELLRDPFVRHFEQSAIKIA